MSPASNVPAVAALDWGTTRLRAWLIDGAGKVLAERRGDDGLITAREKGFANVLESHLTAMGAPEELPVIICGMAGSRQGWLEAPYVSVPSPLGAILGGAARVPDQKRDIRIVPGLAQRLADAPDVMRGEETQLAGAGLPAKGRHLVCMPGTHSKWVLVEDGAVTGFGTWPTGELFSVLAAHSILRHSLGEHPSPVAADNPFFRRWCEIALGEGGDVTSRLFAIRAAGLLQDLKADDAAACLSGLLIGGEIASARRRHGAGATSVVLVASGALAVLYQAALGLAGLGLRTVDADEAVRAGLIEAARENGMIARTGAAL
ncbi:MULTISPECIES: 2-dehydro-3-deoxygalactonokinase [unclassified Mesorhizobium]|uniref:2-dehydro-3-deoxygalactonokinase n=2 Tax=Mesorhizobium TaxID=68287 RepID=UPI000FDAC3D9|nr:MULTISPECIES: 2-dehydro-3-deoxygalactonokinase [unclassified Mesorhizobium]RWC75356.1 MAG: 2-dehydro-3-deoxygalactonokinase [Mesorhizobium sp.]TGR42789.1 2-dehydro-3-deoxygalactonokinase [bacterium M00.F.Ca.ET.199.01.1.1]TGU30040.1 2-dehydro-3-deoxygalactonokinase [bacterium M00.F.Ca.ET.156.01.1.1]TGV84768.1 2-dehydro-3-deoxygalactonokinase [Mesorhizobium sp. M00.F.Ca.ET.149.01.1.1]TGQ02211.1 2-dehydro-3-deoxygalactonokinase [Mesorhizobium sp. M8A.F.Ca.ET.218.01.1.1]